MPTRPTHLTAACRLAACAALLCSLSGSAHAARAYSAEIEAGYSLVAADRAFVQGRAFLAGGPLLERDGGLVHGASIGGRFYVAPAELFMVGVAARYAAGSGPGGFGQLGFLGARAMFKLDILQWVPFATLDVGWLVASLGENAGREHELEVAVGLGVDYLLSRSLAVGGFARYHVAATGVSHLPAMLTAGVRIAFRWE